MEIPARYIAIIEDVVSRVSKYTEKGRVPAPTLIKGNLYSGSALLVHEIYRKLCNQKDRPYNMKFLRLRLSDTLITNEISRELSLLGKSSNKSSIFFIDGIDRILNFSSKNIKRGVKRGRSAKASEIVEESHKLRKILLENTNKISLISSAGLNTKFMEDPDLPFYKFFNEITMSPLLPEEAVKYFFNLVKKNSALDAKSQMIAELGELSIDWPFKISGGNWLLLQKFHEVITINSKFQTATNTKNVNVLTPLEEYYLQIQPILMMEISTYSREERRFIEKAAMLAQVFELKELEFDAGNTSQVAKLLVDKNILAKIEKKAGKNSKYAFSHVALRTLIRYFSGANLIDVFSDQKVLK